MGAAAILAGLDQVDVDVETDTVALFVALESPYAGRFNDNGFVLLPNERRTLSFLAAEAVDLADFEATLVVRSYSDVLAPVTAA